MIALYRAGKTHTVRGIVCEIGRFPLEQMEEKLQLGWLKTPEEINKPKHKPKQKPKPKHKLKVQPSLELRSKAEVKPEVKPVVSDMFSSDPFESVEPSKKTRKKRKYTRRSKTY